MTDTVTNQHLSDAFDRFDNLTETVDPENMFVLWLVMGMQMLKFVHRIEEQEGFDTTEVDKFFGMAADTMSRMYDECDFDRSETTSVH
tara:strand:+ start:671 stop:934 length:264 start_codon:yes stop_codon:yes gene_type:complete